MKTEKKNKKHFDYEKLIILLLCFIFFQNIPVPDTMVMLEKETDYTPNNTQIITNKEASHDSASSLVENTDKTDNITTKLNNENYKNPSENGQENYIFILSLYLAVRYTRKCSKS